MITAEIMKGLKTSSEIVILDFNEIPDTLPDFKNIRKYFSDMEAHDLDPKLPENRQKFNNRFLSETGKRYLVGRYGEDRIAMLKGTQIADEGRTLHLGVDVFCEGLEPVYSPLAGEIVRVGREDEEHSFGNYVILEHRVGTRTLFSFIGHLSEELPNLGEVKGGDRIASVGDFKNNENGGWSRHIHFQLLTELPGAGETPLGYSTIQAFAMNQERYPNPSEILGL